MISRLLLILLLVADPALAAETMRFWNLTGMTITSLSLAPAGSEKFGANQCANDADGAVDSDERLRLSDAEPGHYDVRLGFKNGRMCTVHNVQLRGTGKYAFSLEPADLTRCR